ncbi:ATP-dependent DNA ligase [Lacisediminihabitans profunda]|uniref:DNA ligase (ATP) n=1 Tax=Lacisediminihabitans profunda TaxID=2594790 RepID=A0A5C8UND2_9MICO|nr:ATP-dependent DNA ligase [Lacisediminihabitans profunda]TXN29010.1 ATP-dependent DNA ligase [Lacisediminihabitans profunda]
MASDDSERVTVDGHRLTLTNLDKVLYPSTGTTKRDVLAYYAEIADVLVPHAANRPATRKRWVHGVGTPEHPGQSFFQKNLEDSAPSWVKRRTIQHSDHTNVYPLVNDRATLVWLGQLAALEIHVPQWQFGRTGVVRNPDRLVLDLDPGEGVGLAECAEVARYIRAILGGMGLDPMPVTSGSKGIHLYAAIDGAQTSDQVSAVAHELARSLEADHPDLVVSDMKKALRGGKVLVDWSQNSAAKTTITPYSLRGRAHPMVAAPRTWRELASPDLAQLDYREVLRRVKRRGDPLAGVVSGHLESLEPTAARMRGFEAAPDRLDTYRGMRNAGRTPEPVPSHAPAPSDGQSFVIQEHHARRLHFDFRLEHDGVLVSWALPKGVPTDPQHNHLAVQTEDHPLEYGEFEGTIPRGEYGAGAVSIWDAGRYDLEKWREGEEVIVTLHGRENGGLGAPRRVALIHTGRDEKTAQNWLIHLMKDAGAASATPPSTVAPPKAATPSATRPVSPTTIAPMLATLGSVRDVSDDDDWAFEMKWDGIRAIASVENGSVRLTSRNGKDLTASYPELGQLGSVVSAATATIDGEIVALDSRGRPDFGLLQTRMNLTKASDVERSARSTPVHFMAFDLLAVDGRSLLAAPYDERRACLEAVLVPGASSGIQVPPSLTGSVDSAVAVSRELGLEGVVAKRRTEPYRPGVRSRSWIKIKHHMTQEVVIGGWRPGNGRRASSIGSLLVGVPEGETLRYVGRVGTGFTDRQLDDIARILQPLAREAPSLEGVPSADGADAHWVSPTLVGEVEFAEWTSSGRLRQPSWRGWRPDKSPAEVRIE